MKQAYTAQVGYNTSPSLPRKPNIRIGGLRPRAAIWFPVTLVYSLAARTSTCDDPD